MKRFTAILSSCGVGALAATAGLLLSVRPAPAQVQGGAATPMANTGGALAERLPAGCNAVLSVDVAHLVDSPWGKQNNLRAKLTAGYADRPLPVPASAKRAVVGAQVNPFGLASTWQAAVIEVPAAPQIQPMIKAQGGYFEMLSGKQAAWSSRDVFFVALDGHTLGLVHPGQRRQAAAWAASTAAGGAALPPYVTKALAASGNADAVLALDLHDAVSPAAIAYALSLGELPSLERVENGMDTLMAALSSVVGSTVTVHAGADLQAEWVIDFDKDVSALGANANALVLDVLKSAGVYEPQSEQWDFKAVGKRVVGRRALDDESFARMIAFLSPPSAPADAPGGADAQPAAARENAGPTAQASQTYYRAVAKIVDGLGPKASSTQGASTLAAQARRVEQLPILDVDPALIEWGGSVSNAISRAGQELAIGNERAQAAAAGIATPTVTSTTYGSNSTPEARAALRTAQDQRRQASQTERAAAATRALDILNTLGAPRGKVRSDMAQKYHVEF